MKRLAIILILLSLAACSTLQDTLKRHGYMDGLPNLRNRDVADVARLAEALGVDPDNITLGQLLNEADKERFKPTPTPTPTPTPLRLDPETIRAILEAVRNESHAENPAPTAD